MPRCFSYTSHLNKGSEISESKGRLSESGPDLVFSHLKYKLEVILNMLKTRDKVFSV